MRVVAIIVILTGGLLVGCALKGDMIGVRKPTGDSSTAWRIKAATMRVYPSTRFVRIEDQLVLEARIEFLDELGDSIKASGSFVFEVFDAERVADAVDAERLYSWKVAMLTREANVEFYDAVTRAYLFRLSVDGLPTRQTQVVLKVSFDRPGDRALSVMGVVNLQ